MADEDKPEVRVELHSIPEYNDPINNFKVPEDIEYNHEEESGFRFHPDPIVENYFHLVAIKGCTFFPWNVVKEIFVWKLTTVVDDWIEEEILENTEDDGHAAEKMIYFRKIKAEILNKVQGFDGAPFTIQRLSELLATPQKNYKDVAKYLRALERTVNVVTCVSPLGERNAKTEDDSEEEEDEPNINIENSFIVSVDELDDPVEVKKAHLEEELKDLKPDENGIKLNPSESTDEEKSEKEPVDMETD